MPLWAKVDVDMPTDRKLLGQPISTRHLWTCLVCLAKKQDLAGEIHGYDCGVLAGAFNIPRKAVAAALTHYQANNMIELEVSGVIRLLNFTKRQGDVSVATKRAVWRDRQARHREVSRVTEKTEVEEEVELEKEKEERKDLTASSFSQDPEIARASQTDATPTEQAKLKHALGLDRRAVRG